MTMAEIILEMAVFGLQLEDHVRRNFGPPESLIAVIRSEEEAMEHRPDGTNVITMISMVKSTMR